MIRDSFFAKNQPAKRKQSQMLFKRKEKVLIKVHPRKSTVTLFLMNGIVYKCHQVE